MQEVPAALQVLVRVQHHPARAQLLPRLLEHLDPLPVEVVTHQSDPPNPWHGYLSCLDEIPDCTHLLVIQDDAVPCRNFGPAVQNLVGAHPETPIVLYLGWIPARLRKLFLLAQRQGRTSFSALLSGSDFCPVVATIWPRDMAIQLRQWEPTHPTLRVERSDDAMAAKFLQKHRQTLLVTVPSLVEHPDMVPSVKGHDNTGYGKDRNRVAISVAEDALRYWPGSSVAPH